MLRNSIVYTIPDIGEAEMREINEKNNLKQIKTNKTGLQYLKKKQIVRKSRKQWIESINKQGIDYEINNPV